MTYLLRGLRDAPARVAPSLGQFSPFIFYFKVSHALPRSGRAPGQQHLNAWNYWSQAKKCSLLFAAVHESPDVAPQRTSIMARHLLPAERAAR